MTKYFLSVISIFKNESHILEEWINHYIKEGIEHFYLFNNNSTDNFMDIINKYNKYIDLFHAKEPGEQLKHLNSHYDIIKNETKWLLSIDLDEFIFAKENYKTIPDIINHFDNNIENLGLIRTPWYMFNSNEFIQQPKYVIPSFTNRRDYHVRNISLNCKYIVKTELCNTINVHYAKVSGKTILSNGSDDIGVYNKNRKVKLTSNNSDDHLLQLNHYILQSKEWFFNVKATRGDVHGPGNMRNKNYFNLKNREHSGYTDELLKNKKYLIV